VFTFIDGHLILAAIAAPVVALLLVGNANAWQRHKAAKRQELHRRIAARRAFLTARGGAR